ncbi:unnamed protein product [Symbiodinium sp. KB8]|nr:unnamed protein product [Symbiodinium sp. KB8]
MAKKKNPPNRDTKESYVKRQENRLEKARTAAAAAREEALAAREEAAAAKEATLQEKEARRRAQEEEDRLRVEKRHHEEARFEEEMKQRRMAQEEDERRRQLRDQWKKEEEQEEERQRRRREEAFTARQALAAAEALKQRIIAAHQLGMKQLLLVLAELPHTSGPILEQFLLHVGGNKGEVRSTAVGILLLIPSRMLAGSQKFRDMAEEDDLEISAKAGMILQVADDEDEQAVQVEERLALPRPHEPVLPEVLLFLQYLVLQYSGDLKVSLVVGLFLVNISPCEASPVVVVAWLWQGREKNGLELRETMRLMPLPALQEADKQLDHRDAALGTSPATSPKKATAKTLTPKKSSASSAPQNPGASATPPPKPKQNKTTPKSSGKIRPPSLGGRGKDTKKRAGRGTVGTFAGRRLPPTPHGAAQFVKIRDAYYKIKSDNGKPRIPISQTDFWQKISVADDFEVALNKYVQLHWSK